MRWPAASPRTAMMTARQAELASAARVHAGQAPPARSRGAGQSVIERSCRFAAKPSFASISSITFRQAGHVQPLQHLDGLHTPPGPLPHCGKHPISQLRDPVYFTLELPATIAYLQVAMRCCGSNGLPNLATTGWATCCPNRHLSFGSVRRPSAQSRTVRRRNCRSRDVDSLRDSHDASTGV